MHKKVKKIKIFEKGKNNKLKHFLIGFVLKRQN